MMNKCHENLNFVNNTTPALNDTNMNYIDGCIDILDNRIVTFDTTKANQSDLLQTVKGITYNTSTGVITVTWWNGNTLTIDLNIEKIPVNFTMSESGVITMTTADGTVYTADISTVLKLYNFVDSDEINFTVTQNGNNYTVTASIVEGSITADKLQPNFLADCEAAQAAAEAAADEAEAKALVSEGWAKGTQGGIPVGPDSPYYEKSAAYYAEATGGTSLAALNDTQISNPEEGEVLTYDETLGKWKNGAGVKFATLPVTNLTAVAGDSQVTLSWTNPEDVVVGGTTVAELEMIKVYRDNVLIERALISTYTDTGLVNGQTYVYTVVAETTKGVESAVATISATPVATEIAVSITNAGANASVTVTDGTDTYTATADASGNASVVVGTSGTYTITANGTGENKRYATEVVVGDSAVSVKMLNVPSQYKEVAYIESHGNEYIDTGLSLTTTTGMLYDFEKTSTSGTQVIFGVYTGGNANNFYAFSDSGSLKYNYGDSDKASGQSLSTARHTLKFNYTGAYSLLLDGTTIANNTQVRGTTAYHIYLFAYNSNNQGAAYKSSDKLYRATFTEGNVVTRDFIPCYRKSDSKPGLYDIVNDVFYDNDGTGAFGYAFNPEDLEQKTFTLEGAKEDNITAKLGGTTVGTCIFASGQTSGTVTLDVPSDGSSIPFVFESSVAKDTTSGTSNYTKTVNMSKDTTSVKVMPDGALYWYGNECVDITGGWIKSSTFTDGTFTKNTNNLSVSNVPIVSSGIGMAYTVNAIDTSGAMNLKGILSTNIVGASSSETGLTISKRDSFSYADDDVAIIVKQTSAISLRSASFVGHTSGYVACVRTYGPSTQSSDHSNITMYALWLE